MVAQILITSSAALMLVVGALHLQGSFFLFDRDLEPKDAELKTRMQSAALTISPKTNLWRAWIGFNAMFALGLLLFGFLFGYLALFRMGDLEQMPLLLLVGGLYLASLVLLSSRYLFYLPALGFALCLVLFGFGAGAALL